jgi:hypothetical protein
MRSTLALLERASTNEAKINSVTRANQSSTIAIIYLQIFQQSKRSHSRKFSNQNN